MSKVKPLFTQKMSSDTDIEAYLNKLSSNETISNKMNKLCELSALTKYDIASREGILDNIHRLFQSFYPDCSLVAFGSSVNNFGVKGCDMDMMFLPSPDYEHLDNSEINKDGKIPTLKKARTDPTIKTQLKYMNQEKHLRFLSRVLQYNRDRFKQAVYIPAKCPIVKFYTLHQYYHLWCDLSFQHSLPTFNSELLRFFSMIDSRIKPLMITLRFWAKHLNIISIGSFSSYAFSLLVIFFLQNIEEPLLPSVNALMINAESCIVDGWEAGFVSDVEQCFVSRNALSGEELLKEFFRFYWNFDFARNVVCIRTGEAMPLSNIIKDADERMKKFKVTDICVQDPFDLSHNVASSRKLLKVHLLKPYFFVANLIISKQLQSPEKEDIFELLFKKELYESKIKELFFFPKSDLNIFEYFHVYPNCEIIATIGDNFEKLWFKQVCEAIRDILDYIFFFNCEVIDKHYSFENIYSSNDYLKSNQKQDQLLLSIQCAVDNRVWKYRNIKLDMPLDHYTQNHTNKVLKEENSLSHYVLASNPALQCSEPFSWFLCNCYQSRYSQIPCIWIYLIPLCPISSEFRSLSKVLKNVIPKTIDKMLINQ